MDLDLPARFGRYTLESVLGQGGAAVVYRAVLHGPAGFQKRVAVKVAHDRGTRPWLVPSLYAEGRIAGRLRHRHVVDVYEVGEVQGRPYIAMELVEGMTLAALIHSSPSRPQAVSCAIAVAIVRGLCAAHELRDEQRPLGLVHRDLKPSNVLVGWDGSVKLADFGIASWSEREGGDGAVDRWWGTPRYMSPEQSRMEALDARSDLFSLGLVLGELVLGGSHAQMASAPHPWADPSTAALGEMDLALPGLGAVVSRCVQPEPADRHPDARAVLKALQEVQARLPAQPDLASWMEERLKRSMDVTGRIGAMSAAAVAAPPRAMALPPPVYGTPFIGRVAEMTAVRAALDGSAQVVTLLGPGGIGKTRLALEVAAGRACTWFCDLTEARTSEEVLVAAHDVLGLRMQAGADAAVEELARALSGGGLWIWDNVEQVVDPLAALLTRLSARAPKLRSLCTSREPLRIQGEVCCPVRPLSKPESETLFRSCAGGLLKEGSDEVQQSLEVVTRHCDGMPLALELAAGKVRVMGIQQLAGRIPESLRLLRSRDRDRPVRHQSMRDNLDWSWQLLESWEQQAMAQLSVFRGGFQLESAEAVVDLGAGGAPWMVEVIEALLDKSMLQSRPTAHGPRFSMFMVMRSYAAERLESAGEAWVSSTRDRHAHHLAGLGKSRFLEESRGVRSSVQEPQLFVERDNLKAAFAWCVSSNQPEEAGLCAHALSSIFRRHGPLNGAQPFLERALAGELSRELRCSLLTVRGGLLRLNGQLEAALSLLDEALLLTESAPSHARGTILRNLGLIYDLRGELERGRAVFEEALACLDAVGDRRGMAITWHAQAMLHMSSGDHAAAERSASRGVALSRELGDRSVEVLVLDSLASSRYELGRVEEAESLWRTLIEIRSAWNEPTALYLSKLGRSRLHQGDFIAAREIFETALAQSMGDHHFDRGCDLANLSVALMELGELEEAQQRGEAALLAFRQAKASVPQYTLLPYLAQLASMLGDTQRASGHLSALVALVPMAERDLPPAACRALARVYAQRGQLPQVWDRLKGSVHDLTKLGAAEKLLAMCDLVHIHASRGCVELARQWLQQARALSCASPALAAVRTAAARVVEATPD